MSAGSVVKDETEKAGITSPPVPQTSRTTGPKVSANDAWGWVESSTGENWIAIAKLQGSQRVCGSAISAGETEDVSSLNCIGTARIGALSESKIGAPRKLPSAPSLR